MGDHVRQRRLRSVVRVHTAGVPVRGRARAGAFCQCACRSIACVHDHTLVKSHDGCAIHADFMFLNLGDALCTSLRFVLQAYVYGSSPSFTAGEISTLGHF